MKPSLFRLAHSPASITGYGGHSQGKIVDAISIRERPAEVEDRAIPGHWEGDLLRGAGNTHVVTLVERKSRFCVLVKVPGKDAATVVAALMPVPRGPTPGGVASLADLGPWTGDGPTQNLRDGDGYAGLLLRSAESLAAGLEQNTNGLLRQYLPKNADLSRFSQSELDEIALRLNTRPRQTFGYELQRINCRPVLRRPLETTPFLRTWPNERPKDVAKG